MTHYATGGDRYACGKSRRRLRFEDSNPDRTTCGRCMGTEAWSWAAMLTDYTT